MNPLDEMAEELAAADVHAGFTEQRAALARRLLHAGVSAGDVVLLSAHCRDTVRDGSPAAVLAALLQDDARREARLQDLRVVAQIKAQRAKEACRAFGDKPTTPGPTEGEDRRKWAYDRNALIATCRVFADRRPREVVADEMGVSMEQLEEFLVRGRQIRGEPPKRFAVVDDREEDERRRQFREQMRAARRSQ